MVYEVSNEIDEMVQYEVLVQVYDPASNQLYMASDMHDPIASSAVFAHQGKIYSCGGYNTAQPEFTFSSKLVIGVPEF